MTARDDLVWRLQQKDALNEHWANRQVDAYLREVLTNIAAWQRAWLADESNRTAIETRGASALPDLIDPDVTTEPTE